jgi:Tol biopolymer transport system component
MARALRRSGDPRLIAIGAVAAVALTAIVAIFLTSRPDTFHGTGSRLLLTEQDEEAWTTSPDGRYLAVSAYDTDDLVLRDLGSGKVRQVTHGAGRCWAVFSPDGKRIAFVRSLSRTESELHIIGADGNGERTLFRNPQAHPYPLDWSPDGRQILVRLLRDDTTAELVSISAEDGAVQPLRVPRQTQLNRALFAEDSSSIVFDAHSAGESRTEIHRLSRDGKESTLVGRPGSNWLIAWSPDRRRLVFFSDRKGTAGIWSTSVSGGAAGEPRELAPNVGRWTPLGITRTGSLLYRSEADTLDVYTAVLDLAAGRTVTAPAPVMDRFMGTHAYPNWSEDGRRLVFESNRTAPAQPALILYEPVSGLKRELTIDLARLMRPQWTAHGTSIMVVGQAKDGETGQYRIDPATGKATLFMTSKDLQAPYEGAWSADGRIYFNRYMDWRRGLFRLNVRTRERRVIYVPPPGVDLGTENLALAPDGRTLAFHARNDAAKSAALMVVPAEGGAARPLLTVTLPERFLYGSFTWTPDSRAILAARTRGAVSEIWQVPVDGTPPSKIDFPYQMRILSLRLNPDGKTIAFGRLDYRSEIWTLQNFL